MIARVLAVWFCAALVISVSGIYVSVPPLAVAATVWGLTLILLIVYKTSPLVRKFALTVDMRALVALHLIRFVGVWFLILYRQGRFPFAFGAVGGVGDVLVACGALALLTFGMPRNALFAWNFFGFADIFGVVSSALREGLRDPHAMLPLREFPLSLLPLFFVPLIIACHLLIFNRLGQSSSNK